MDLAILKYKRNTEEIEPLTYKGSSLDFNETAQRRLLNAYIALNGSTDTVLWTCADDSLVELSANDIKEIFKLGFKRSNELHNKYADLKERVNNGEEVEW